MQGYLGLARVAVAEAMEVAAVATMAVAVASPNQVPIFQTLRRGTPWP